MHELSIAYSLVEAANAAAQKAGATHVTAVQLRLGELAGVVKDALQFSYDIAVKGTRLEGSQLKIEDMPVLIFCERCNDLRPIVSLQRFHCSVCDTPSAQIRQGKELEIVALEIGDEDEAFGSRVEGL